MAPTTFRAEPSGDPKREGVHWNDHASIRRIGTNGLFSDFSILHQGTFAQMIEMMARMSANERSGLIIEKAGDREFGPEEVMALYRRTDFPGG